MGKPRVVSPAVGEELEDDKVLAGSQATEVADDEPQIVEKEVAPSVGVPTEKKIRIHTTEDVHAVIAKQEYNLRDDKDYDVPAGVAAILCNSKLAYRK